jgi:gas vesicle protein
MKILIGGICGAVVGCITLVGLLWLALQFAPGDDLGREVIAFGAVSYVPYLAIIGAVIGGLIGAKRVAARIADSQSKSSAASRQP